MKEEIKIYTPQFERAEKLDYQPPTNETEFYNIINTAPTKTLFGFGFRKWSTMNDCIKENIESKDSPGMVILPTYNLDDAVDIITGKSEPEPVSHELFEIGCKRDTPMELLPEDKDIWLFPKEWYDIIPNGFMVTGLYGESYPFERGKSDDDIRFGCLAYGIQKSQQS